MRIDEIEIGTEYKGGTYGARRVRAEAIEKRPAGYGRMARKVLCTYLDDRTGEPVKAGHPDAVQDADGNQQAWYSARDLTETWSDYVEQQQRHDAEWDRRQDLIDSFLAPLRQVGLDVEATHGGRSRRRVSESTYEYAETVRVEILVSDLEAWQKLFS